MRNNEHEFIYFTKISIKTDESHTPDIRAAKVLEKYNCKVTYKLTTEIVPVEVKSDKDVYIDKYGNQRTKTIRPEKGAKARATTTPIRRCSTVTRFI